MRRRRYEPGERVEYLPYGDVDSGWVKGTVKHSSSPTAIGEYFVQRFWTERDVGREGMWMHYSRMRPLSALIQLAEVAE